MNIETSRHKLPLLAVGQAQKEYTHNEALLLVDSLLNPSVRSIIDDPEAIDDSQNISNETRAWLISDMPSGIWSQRANEIAILTANGFRYIEPIAGMRIFNEQSDCLMIYKDMSWYIAPTLAAPTDGSVIDSQARDSISAILDNLRQFGLSRL